MKKFIPIAMKCNLEQFNKIKHKFKDTSEMSMYEEFFIVNNYAGQELVLGNFKTYDNDNARIFYPIWNQKTFLESCGIEEEENEVVEVIWKLKDLEYRIEGDHKWRRWDIQNTDVRVKPRPDCSAQIEELQRQIDELKKKCL